MEGVRRRLFRLGEDADEAGGGETFGRRDEGGACHHAPEEALVSGIARARSLAREARGAGTRAGRPRREARGSRHLPGPHARPARNERAAHGDRGGAHAAPRALGGVGVARVTLAPTGNVRPAPGPTGMSALPRRAAPEYAIAPPIEPMLAKIGAGLPADEGLLFEPKWDGFRAIVYRGAHDAYIQSRDLRPLDRYFPELHEALLERLPPGCVLDGEIVIAGPQGLDFDALQLRLHPAASRVARLAQERPSAFVAFDALAVDGRDLRRETQAVRRAALEKLLAGAKPPLYLTPMTRDRSVAAEWLARFEGAGLDGVVAKLADLPYEPGKRAMIKVKHVRTADCVVAGLRW